MTIKRHNDTIQLTCDYHKGCDQTFPAYGKDEFHTMMNHARKKGWYAIKRKFGWKHYCDYLHTTQPASEKMLPYQHHNKTMPG